MLTDEALSIRGSSVAGSEQQVKEWAAKFENYQEVTEHEQLYF